MQHKCELRGFWQSEISERTGNLKEQRNEGRSKRSRSDASFTSEGDNIQVLDPPVALVASPPTHLHKHVSL